MSGKCPFHFFNRRQFIKSAAGSLGLAAASTALSGLNPAQAKTIDGQPRVGEKITFWGENQAGITTPQQAHLYFAAFDLLTDKREDVILLLKNWTAAAADLTVGKKTKFTAFKKPDPPAAPKDPDSDDSYQVSAISTEDSSDAEGLGSSRLTLTFGFGSGLFVDKDGRDRYGLAHLRPPSLVDMPKFHGDALAENKTGGDFSIQACGDDPQVVFHAVRELARVAEGIAQLRWTQTGFVSGTRGTSTPRNLMGFKDGTQEPKTGDLHRYVWADQGPEWMRGGSYQVFRRIRIALEHWDRTDVEFQEQVIGRKKDTGAPLGQKHEREVLNLKAEDKDGNPVIPANAHVRLASAEANGGSQMLRRGYSFNEGVNFTAERWPPWRQGLEYDAGLAFISYQSDPRESFIKVFGNMAKLDALNQFVTHVGSGMFACPPGARKGEFIGQKLFV